MLQAIKHFIEKLRALPHNDRLIIFFVTMALALIITGYLAARSTLSEIPKISGAVSSLSFSPAAISESTRKTDADKVKANAGLADDPTADWQTYVSAQVGFKIKHPKTFSAKNYAKLVGVDFNDAIGLYAPKTDLSVADWISKKQGSENAQAPKKLPISQYSALQFQTNGILHTVFSDQGKIVDVYYGTTNSEDDTDTYHKMLDTFTFITQ